MPDIDINHLNVVVAVLGGFMVVYGLIAVKIKNAWYLGEALPALVIGILLGPSGANLLNDHQWAQPAAPNQQDEIALGTMRVMIAIQLVLVGYQLPAKYILTRWKALTVCLVPIMMLMCLAASACVMATIPNLSLIGTTIIGACVTTTDPILSQAIAKGPFADRYVARPLREIISAEAGANDGFGSPFVMLPVNLLLATQHGRGIASAIKDWCIGTLLYIVLMAVAYGALVGLCSRFVARWTLVRRWIDAESYLLFPTALGLFVVGICGMPGTSDLLACFVTGCLLNWDGHFLSETKKRHDEVNSCIDAILNLGGFMYVGIVLPWHEFHDPDGTGITYPRLFALGTMVLLFRRIPAVLITYKLMPGVVASWREAIFMGYFGPIGVGAVYYLENTRHMFFGLEKNQEEKEFLAALSPAVYFLVFFSIIVHGLSIPALSLFYTRRGIEPITEDPVELPIAPSEYEPLPANAIAGRHRGTVIAYNRFVRPFYYIAAARRPTPTTARDETEGPDVNNDNNNNTRGDDGSVE